MHSFFLSQRVKTISVIRSNFWNPINSHSFCLSQKVDLEKWPRNKRRMRAARFPPPSPPYSPLPPSVASFLPVAPSTKSIYKYRRSIGWFPAGVQSKSSLQLFIEFEPGPIMKSEKLGGAEEVGIEYSFPAASASPSNRNRRNGTRFGNNESLV